MYVAMKMVREVDITQHGQPIQRVSVASESDGIVGMLPVFCTAEAASAFYGKEGVMVMAIREVSNEVPQESIVLCGKPDEPYAATTERHLKREQAGSDPLPIQ